MLLRSLKSALFLLIPVKIRLRINRYGSMCNDKILHAVVSNNKITFTCFNITLNFLTFPEIYPIYTVFTIKLLLVTKINGFGPLRSEGMFNDYTRRMSSLPWTPAVRTIGHTVKTFLHYWRGISPDMMDENMLHDYTRNVSELPWTAGENCWPCLKNLSSILALDFAGQSVMWHHNLDVMKSVRLWGRL